MKIRKVLSLLTVLFLSLAIAISCTPSPQTSTSGSSGSSAPIRLGFSAWPGWFPWEVADEKKLFEANNAKVDLKWFDAYFDSINALKAGQLDANSQTLNDTISSVAAGADLVVVLVNDNSTGNNKIIVREEINSIAELQGKTIAVKEGTVDHFLLLQALKKAGLSANDVTIQSLETEAMSAAFVAEQVDAVAAFAPSIAKALERPGSKELFSSTDFPGAISNHLVVTRKLVNERPKEVQSLVNTWFNTLDFMDKNAAESLKILMQRAGVTVEEYKEYDAGTKIFSSEDNLNAFQSGNKMMSLPYAAEEISKFLVEAGLVKEKPDVSKIFDDRFVKAYAEKQKA
jgi:NitT/TauT family transport system substrate-binding protein